jgi:hypothetical protein
MSTSALILNSPQLAAGIASWRGLQHNRFHPESAELELN